MNGLIEKLEGKLASSCQNKIIDVQLDSAELSYLISLIYGEKAYEKKMEELLFKEFDKTLE